MSEILWKAKALAANVTAAGSYLTLVMPRSDVETAMGEMRKHLKHIEKFKAKDILRASNTQLLPETNEDVAAEFKKVAKHTKLHPLILVRRGDKLYIADGYHRLCAAYYLNKNAEIHALLVNI